MGLLHLGGARLTRGCTSLSATFPSKLQHSYATKNNFVRLDRDWRAQRLDKDWVSCGQHDNSRIIVARSATLSQVGAPFEDAREEGSNENSNLIPTLFRWPRHIPCDKVELKGSFDGWNRAHPLQRSSASGDWTCVIPLPPGRVHFKFMVDGRYMTSPSEPVVNEKSGTYNNVRLVHPSAVFTWPTALLGGGRVSVVGEWDFWERQMDLTLDRSKCHSLRCCLPPGKYAYYFLVDGEIRLRPGVQGSTPSLVGRAVNFIQVSQTPSVRLFYATGWDKPKIRARWLDASGKALTDWSTVDLHETAARSHGSSSSNHWSHTILDKSAMECSCEPAELEFVPFDFETLKEDHPGHGGSYRCGFPGGYKLESGVIRPFNQACEPPMMLVSDIDGTLVGTSEESAGVTARFAKYWEERASLTGSFLVYNTGRSLGQMTGLLESLEGILPIPDALITAVGTKIYLLDRENGHRGSASGLGWHEDLDWARSLDSGWNLAQVRQAAKEIIQHFDESKVNWLDDGSEHPHRIALSAHVDFVEEIKYSMQEKLRMQGIHFKIISSGTMDWRYIDIVSGNAGKHAALEHMRSLFGIAVDRCVAAGDSGNDILMLEGPNPGIVVGNAQSALVEWVVRQPQDGRLIVADSNLADGVLEGLCRLQLY